MEKSSEDNDWVKKLKQMTFDDDLSFAEVLSKISALKSNHMKKHVLDIDQQAAEALIGLQGVVGK